MKKAPIKRHPALVAFSKDHHFGLLLVWKIRQGIAGGTDVALIKDYTRYFYNADLQYHFEEEEQYLFALLPNDEATIKALNDHKEIRELIEGLNNKDAGIEALQHFAEVLENHIRFEERMLFNDYQNKLTEEQLDALLKVELKERNDVDLDWDNHFWVRKK